MEKWNVGTMGTADWDLIFYMNDPFQLLKSGHHTLFIPTIPIFPPFHYSMARLIQTPHFYAEIIACSLYQDTVLLATNIFKGGIPDLYHLLGLIAKAFFGHIVSPLGADVRQRINPFLAIREGIQGNTQ